MFMFALKDRCLCVPASRLDFVMWWFPEVIAALACVLAGLLVWGPLTALVVVPLIGPAAHLVCLAVGRRQAVRRARARFLAAERAVRDRAACEPVNALADRLDRPQLAEVER